MAFTYSWTTPQLTPWLHNSPPVSVIVQAGMIAPDSGNNPQFPPFTLTGQVLDHSPEETSFAESNAIMHTYLAIAGVGLTGGVNQNTPIAMLFRSPLIFNDSGIAGGRVFLPAGGSYIQVPMGMTIPAGAPVAVIITPVNNQYGGVGNDPTSTDWEFTGDTDDLTQVGINYGGPGGIEVYWVVAYAFGVVDKYFSCGAFEILDATGIIGQPHGLQGVPDSVFVQARRNAGDSSVGYTYGSDTTNVYIYGIINNTYYYLFFAPSLDIIFTNT